MELSVTKELIVRAEPAYAAFTARSIPTIAPDSILGIRLPGLRSYAKSYIKTEECEAFYHALPHRYHDENLLHAILLCSVKPYERCVELVEEFLPFVDNWAVCDTLRPKCFTKNREDLLQRIQKWTVSEQSYTIRFGVGMLMCHFLDEDFKSEYLQIPATIQSEEYYVNMMLAWYYATALAKQWDATIGYFEGHRLTDWVHKKSIQKARESYRITPEQKAYLKTLSS